MRNRTGVSVRQQDIELLTKLIEEFGDQLRKGELEAFKDMHTGLCNGTWSMLTEKQRAWCKKKLEDFIPEYENLVSSGKVPRGKEVVMNIGPLPKRPPQKPRIDD